MAANLLANAPQIARGLSRLTPQLMTSAKGSWATLDDGKGGGGKKYLDFTSGIGVVNLGHCHKKVSEAAAKQCMELVHGQCSIAYHPAYLSLLPKLQSIMPDPSLDTFFLWNSGSEAVEAAIKLARAATKKQNIIVMQGGYHGRTFGAMGLTRSKTVYSQGYHPLMPGVFVTPFPYFSQMGLPKSTPTSQLVEQSLVQLQLVLSQQTTAADTAAILVEPVLGEGGYVPAPIEFLRGLRKICDEKNILLIVDEVQSGFGRTGRMFYSSKGEGWEGVKPDIMVMAKGLANGFPLSAIASRREITDRQDPGTMGGTYAGNAVSCAAAVAVVDAFKEEKVLENVTARSKQLFSSLEELRSRSHISSSILDVRGSGLMVGVEFASPTALVSPNSKAPKNMAARVSKKCLERGMLLLTTSVFEVVRFIPPLTVSEEDMRKGCEIFAESVEDVVKEG